MLYKKKKKKRKSNGSLIWWQHKFLRDCLRSLAKSYNSTIFVSNFLDYILRTSINLIKNGFTLNKRTKSKLYPAETMTDADNACDLALLANKAEFMSIGFTVLYFEIVVIPLVPETKIVDVSKLISFGNLMVRKVTWFMRTTTSATLILSRAFGADCITRIAYIYFRLQITHSFSHFHL